MSLRDIFRKGIRQVLQNWKFMLLLWFSNGVVALVMSLSVFYMLIGHLKYSLTSDRINAGFDHIWFVQFFHNYKDNIGEIPITIYGFVGMYALIQVFYSGGLISIFKSPKKNHFMDFFYGGVKFWWRFLKITLAAIFFYAMAFLFNDLLGEIIFYAFKNTELELADFILRSLRYLLLIFIIMVVSMMTDYLKISMCLEDNLVFHKQIKPVIILIKDNFLKVVGLFLIISIIGLVAGLAYNIIGKFVPRTPAYFLILAFLLQQLLVIFRLFIRMFFYSTEVLLYNDLNAEVIETEVQKVEVKV